MKTRAAVLWDTHQEWKIEEVELDDPGPMEVLVKTKVAGMCHSDEHMVTGDLSFSNEAAAALGIDAMFPMIGGHEGAGEVIAIGPGVTQVAVGDHVACSFIPACGKCHYCSKGQQQLCDLGAKAFMKGMIADGRDAHHIGDVAINTFAKLGTFSEYMLLSQDSIVKIDSDLPFAAAALVSCGVATGFGSAINRAEVKAGDTVVIIGCGGVGMNAVQGAAVAGAKRVIAVDPVEFKREKAMEFGATHTFASVEEATAELGAITWGRMADSAIITVGVADGNMLAPAMGLIGKGGTLVVTSIANMMESAAQVSLFDLAMMNKQIRGTIFGSASPNQAIPELLSMYREGRLKLDELVTNTYTLDDVNQGYEDMRNGKNIRGIIVFD
jgi:S-(hydroxymethyl)glutathione dehydrogenase/alcohol dehydrogenase